MVTQVKMDIPQETVDAIFGKRKPSFKEKAMKFFSDHKEELVLAALAAGSFAFGFFIAKPRRVSSYGEDIFDTLPDKPYRGIDEDIFTNIAPEIEAALLEEGLDDWVIDKTYAVPFPKGGDWRNGVYEVDKNVHILIRDTCGQVKGERLW